MTLALRLVRIQLGPAKAALTELRDLARGIHPAILTESGLTAAVEGLAARSLIPTVVDASVDGRLPQAIEAAAYFFVSEAIADVAKHARASRIVITLAIAEKRLLVTVADDTSVEPL